MTTGLWIIGYGSLIFKPPPHTSFRVDGYIKGFIRRFWQSSSDHRGTPESPGRVVTLIALEDLKTNSKFHNDLHMYELRDGESKPHPETDLLPKDTKLQINGEKHINIEDHKYKIDRLVEDDLKVWGCAYYIAPEHVDEVREYLDVREQDGYTLHKVPFFITSDEEIPASIRSTLLTNTDTSQKDTTTYYLESNIYIGTIENESFIGPEDVENTGAIIKGSIGPSGENSEYLFNLCSAVRDFETTGISRDYYLEELVQIVEREKKKELVSGT